MSVNCFAWLSAWKSLSTRWATTIWTRFTFALNSRAVGNQKLVLVVKSYSIFIRQEQHLYWTLHRHSKRFLQSRERKASHQVYCQRSSQVSSWYWRWSHRAFVPLHFSSVSESREPNRSGERRIDCRIVDQCSFRDRHCGTRLDVPHRNNSCHSLFLRIRLQQSSWNHLLRRLHEFYDYKVKTNDKKEGT